MKLRHTSYNGRLLICFLVLLLLLFFCFLFCFLISLYDYNRNFRINQTACQPIFIWLLCIRVYYGFCFCFFFLFSICAIIVLFNSFKFYTVHCVAYFFLFFIQLLQVSGNCMIVDYNIKYLFIRLGENENY